MKNVCLGPYQITAQRLEGDTSTTFVNKSLPRRMVVVFRSQELHKPPTGDAVLLHESIGAPEIGFNTRWYEIPSQLGRRYLIFTTPIEVLISSFEDGLLLGPDAFGVERFKFGQKYTKSEQMPSASNVTTFEFDGSFFSVSGQKGMDYGLFDSSIYESESEISVFGMLGPDQPGTGTLPTNPPIFVPTIAADESDPITGSVITSEDKTEWTGLDGEEAGDDVICQSFSAIPRTECLSHTNPDIAARVRGDSIVAYEQRDKDGITSVQTHLFDNAGTGRVVYYRSLARGRLLNNDPTGQFSAVTLEVFDDVDLSDVNGPKMVFLSGPLKGGSPMAISSQTRQVQSDGHAKHIFTIATSGREVKFPDSNNISDIEFAIVGEPVITGSSFALSSFASSDTPIITPFAAPHEMSMSVFADNCPPGPLSLSSVTKHFVYLGNIYEFQGQLDDSYFIKEIRIPADVPPGTDIWVSVWIDGGVSDWPLVWNKKIVSQFSGKTIYSSGPINIPVHLRPGITTPMERVAIGIGVGNKDATFYRDTSIVPDIGISTSYGVIKWGWEISPAVPPLFGTYQFSSNPSGNFNLANNYLYEMQICLGNDNGTTPTIQRWTPGTVEIGSDKSSETQYHYFAGNGYVFVKSEWQEASNSASLWLSEIQQDIETSVPNQIVWFEAKIWSSNNPAQVANPVVWRKEVTVVNPGRQWITSGPCNIDLNDATEAGFQAFLTIGISARTPSIKFFRDNQSWGRASSFWASESVFGSTVGKKSLQGIPPLSGDINDLSGSSQYETAYHQRLVFTTTNPNAEPEITTNTGGCHLVGMNTLKRNPGTNYFVGTKISIDNDSLGLLLTEFGFWLNISSATDLYFYILKSPTSGQTYSVELKQIVSAQGPGLNKYMSGAVNTVLQKDAANSHYIVGVAFSGGQVEHYYDSREANLPTWWGSILSSVEKSISPVDFSQMSVSSNDIKSSVMIASELCWGGVTPPEQRGACCLAVDLCQDNTTAPNCAALGGTWQGQGTACVNVDCSVEDPIGACCLESGGCVTVTEDACSALVGNNTWLGADSSCSDCPEIGIENIGACCFPDGSCSDIDRDLCNAIASAIYQGDGTTCSQIACQQPDSTWACCLPDGSCSELTQTQCFAQGGTFRDGQECATTSCPPPLISSGACCRSDGSCYQTTVEDCAANDDVFHGIGSSCSTVECPLAPQSETEVTDLPEHTYLGKSVSSVNPSVAVAHNHYMVDRSEYAFIAYQAYEGQDWNVYLRQLRTSDKDAAAPVYAAPYLFDQPVFEIKEIDNSGIPVVQYEVINSTLTGSGMCALFQVKLINGLGLVNCAQPGSTSTTACGFDIDTDLVYVEALHLFTTNCDNLSSLPNWTVGQTYTGAYPPTVSSLGGNPSCVTLTQYPSFSSWCYRSATCAQTSLLDDPYCPPAYLALKYKPEDLWTLKTDDTVVTRVKYNASINLSDDVFSDTGSEIDFMFVVDFSSSMQQEIADLRLNLPLLHNKLESIGANVRYGLVIFAKSFGGDADPTAFTCSGSCHSVSAMYNGLWATESVSGFTSDISELQESLNVVVNGPGNENGYAAIQYALLDSSFHWRPNAKKIVMLVTDTGDSVGTACGGYDNNSSSAATALSENDAGVILAIRQSGTVNPPCNDYGTGYVTTLSAIANPFFGVFNVSGPYDAIFDQIHDTMSRLFRQSRVIERDESGFDATFLKPAEIIITYDGDLSDKWTYNKSVFEFIDGAPVQQGFTKGLTALPFDLAGGRIYNTDPVHIQGNIDNWVFFSSPGPLVINYPSFGAASIARSNPILIARKATRPKVSINNRNEVFVAYESYEHGPQQIVIKGTGDFAQNSIIGPKGSRITRFVRGSDFNYEQMITLPHEGVNQLCDFVIDKNDVVHIAWQSNRDNQWEIYYANGYNLFEPVRITKVDSRSGHPSIDLDDLGNIFVVYHDNRFGPYEIMMSYKNEKRVVPLLQQDPYLESLRSGYNHYTNTMPVFIANPQTFTMLPGRLWASKSDPLTDPYFEHYLFDIDESNGDIGEGGGPTDPYQIVSLAGGVDGNFYGITHDGELLLLAEPTQDPYLAVDVGDIQVIGEMDLQLDSYRIADASIDYITADQSARRGTLWILLTGLEIDNSTPMIIAQVDLDTAEVLRQATLYETIGWRHGALTTTSDGKFYIVHYGDSFTDGMVSVSDYPILTSNSALFNFTTIETDVTVQVIALATDHNDIIFALSNDNNLYVMGTNGSFSLVSDITDPTAVGDEGPLPLVSGDIRALGYQFSSLKESIGSTEYFHILLEFYDNKNDAITGNGEPSVVIDSRNNLEAFVNVEAVADPYDPYLDFTSRGVAINSGSSGIIYFDAARFRPGSSSLSYPYNFDTNQTYFPKAYLIDSNGNVSVIDAVQEASFSCNKCTRLGSNNFDKGSCSYSFVVTNSGLSPQYFNFQVLFYADENKQSIVRRFDLIANHEDLQYAEVENESASLHWGDYGLLVPTGETRFVQVYPSLDPEAGFLCGLAYYITVLTCSTDEESVCDTFTSGSVTTGTWSILPLTGESISNNAIGADISQIGENLAVAYNDGSQPGAYGNLRYGTFTDTGWKLETIDSVVQEVSMTSVNGRPAVVYRSTVDGSMKYAVKIGSTWSIKTIDTNASGVVFGGVVIEYNGGAAVVYYKTVGGGGAYQIYYAYDSTGLGLAWTKEIIDGVLVVSPDLNIAVIDNEIGITYATQSGSEPNSYIYKRTIDGSFESSIEYPIEIFGSEILDPALVSYQGKPFVFGKQLNGLYWATTNDGGASWFGDLIDSNYVGSRDEATTVNGQPAIVYAKTGDSGVDIRYARLQSLTNNTWTKDTIDRDLAGGAESSRKAFAPYNNSAAVILAGSSPPRVYYSGDILPISGASHTYFCECDSTIFTNKQIALSEMGRWKSSAHGYSDTRITDGVTDSLRPSIRTRSSDAAIIAFENKDKLKAATFRVAEIDDIFGSGTRSWFDYDLNTTGRNLSLTSDMFDWSNIAYEVSDPAIPGQLPRSAVSVKNCKITQISSSSSVSSPASATGCPVDDLVNNVITNDKYIVETIIKKVLVKEDDVQYFTHNVDGTTVPVVKDCNITLEVWGTPEVTALRTRNDINTNYSKWCPWSPERGAYHTEIKHTLSSGSGVKEICLQAMTYSGITAEFCVPVIADYQRPIFQIQLFEDDGFTVPLPTVNGTMIASTGNNPDGSPKTSNRVYIRITVSEKIEQNGGSATNINYDVLQQGINDQLDLVATSVDGQTFTGFFDISREDKIFNKDGLARIRINFPGSCEIRTSGFGVTSGSFKPDRYNLMSAESEASMQEDSVDVLASYRQEVTGRIGADMVLRPSSDPYLIFGDPNYFLTRKDGSQTGVPQPDTQSFVIGESSMEESEGS